MFNKNIIFVSRALCRYYYFLYTAKKLGKKNWTVADVFKHMIVKNNPHKVLFIYEDKEWTTLQVIKYFTYNAYHNVL